MRWILMAMILVMPFEHNPYLSLAPGFTTIKLLGFIGIGLVLWLVFTGQVRLGIWDYSASTAFMAFLGMVAIACVISGASPRMLTRYAGIAFFLPIMIVAIKTETDLRKTIWACASIMILVAPYAYRQMLRYGGRMGVGLYEPNYFAIALVLLIPLALVLAFQQTTRWGQFCWFAGTGVLFTSLILSGSRGGFTGGLLCVSLTLFRMTRHRVLVPLLALAVVFAVMVAVPNELGQRLLATFSSDVHDSGVEASTDAHSGLLQAGIRMIADKPLFGVGLGNFKQMSSRYYPGVTEHIAHNTYIQIGAESGLIALFAFLAVLGFVFRSLVSSGRIALAMGHLEMYGWTIAIQAGLAGFLVSGFFISAQLEKFFWSIVFLAVILERIVLVEAIAYDERATVALRQEISELDAAPWMKWHSTA